MPHSTELEASVLGSLLIDSDAVVKVADMLADDDFFNAGHRYIYEAILQLYEQRRPIDVLTLSDQLKVNHRLDEAGGAAYLAELTNYVPTAAHVVEYANLVAQKSLRRRLSSINANFAELIKDESKELKGVVEEAEAELFKASQRHVKQNVESIELILDANFERLDELHKDKNKLRGVPTGFKGLDNKLAGLQPSDLLIIGARPSMGKTAFALNLAHNVAVQSHAPVLIFSLEMSKEQLVDRLLSMESGVDAWKLRTGDLTTHDFEKISEAMGTLSQAPIFIDDTPAITVNELRTKARREAHQRPLGLIVIDYLQLMSGGSKFGNDFNRVQEISEISRGLKGVARELNIPVIAAAQLSRSVENRPDKKPELSDLRESGSIEQDADVVAFIFREDYYNPETDRRGITDILIKKHRNGPIGNVELFFDKERQRFRSIDSQHADPFQS